LWQVLQEAVSKVKASLTQEEYNATTIFKVI
jgi:hypothetical protein